MKTEVLKSATKYYAALGACALLAGCNNMQFTPIPENVVAESPVDGETPLGEVADEIISMTKTVAVEPSAFNKDVDLLLVLDDSASMKEDLLKLAGKLANFTRMLEASGMNWQMCLTTTQGYNVNGNLQFGVARNWLLNGNATAKILTKSVPQLDKVFKRTIDALPIGSELSWDERGIRSTHEHLQRNRDCYRDNASLAVILISDEDEASMGGNRDNVKPNDSADSFQRLYDYDQPLNRLASIKTLLNPSAQFTFNSIVVMPGDRSCEVAQDVEAPAHFGNLYTELSTLSGGGIGSICENDYSKSLKLFKDRIVNTLKEVELECKPHKNKVIVKVDGVRTESFKIKNTIIEFNQPPQEGSFIELYYDCLKEKPKKD